MGDRNDRQKRGDKGCFHNGLEGCDGRNAGRRTAARKSPVRDAPGRFKRRLYEKPDYG